MTIKEQIKEYITCHPEPKRSDMEELHRFILKVMPVCKLWFLDVEKLGKAGVSGYCIQFKTLKDINLEILEEAIRYGVKDSLRA